MRFWTITAKADGKVLHPCHITGDMEVPGPGNGWAWDAAAHVATRITKRPDPVVQMFDGGKWVEDPALVQAVLIVQVKADNARMVATTYSTDFGKQKKYSRKQQEVMDFRGLAPTTTSLTSALSLPLSSLLPTFATMTASAQRKKFRFAMAQAKLRGVTIDVIIDEFEKAIEANEDRVADWEATEQEAIRAIKAAGTAAAKRAIYAALTWS